MAKTTTYKSDITLGERYRDDQTGLEGVATSAHFYQHAYERIAHEYARTLDDEWLQASTGGWATE